MVKYECPRCCYNTSVLSDMKRHVNQKNMCKLVKYDIIPLDYKDIILKNDNSNSIFNELIKLKKENHVSNIV